MGVKAKIADKLMINAAYGYAATALLFWGGYGTLTYDAFKRAADGVDASATTTLEIVGDTMMRGGLLTGAFMAVCVNLHRFKFGEEAKAELEHEAREERLAPFRQQGPHQ